MTVSPTARRGPPDQLSGAGRIRPDAHARFFSPSCTCLSAAQKTYYISGATNLSASLLLRFQDGGGRYVGRWAVRESVGAAARVGGGARWRGSEGCRGGWVRACDEMLHWLTQRFLSGSYEQLFTVGAACSHHSHTQLGWRFCSLSTGTYSSLDIWIRKRSSACRRLNAIPPPAHAHNVEYTPLTSRLLLPASLHQCQDCHARGTRDRSR